MTVWKKAYVGDSITVLDNGHEEVALQWSWDASGARLGRRGWWLSRHLDGWMQRSKLAVELVLIVVDDETFEIVSSLECEMICFVE
jgi:hypothetical protein